MESIYRCPPVAYPLGEAVTVSGLAPARAHVDIVLGWLCRNLLPIAIVMPCLSGSRLLLLVVMADVRGELAFLGSRLWRPGLYSLQQFHQRRV
jgi:hypothetical protein